MLDKIELEKVKQEIGTYWGDAVKFGNLPNLKAQLMGYATNDLEYLEDWLPTGEGIFAPRIERIHKLIERCINQKREG